MQDNTYIKQQEPDLPDMCALLSSLVRLMSCYVKEPSASYAMTLVHLMNQLQNHPDLVTNPSVDIAIKNAQLIWQEELFKSRTRCTLKSNHFNIDEDSIH